MKIAFGLALLGSLSCQAGEAPPPLSPMRQEAIAGFRYDSKPAPGPVPAAGSPAASGAGDPVDANIVALDPVVVWTDRGLSPRQSRALNSALQQQEKAASDHKFSIVKVHEVKLSRKVYFGYVTILGVPVAAGFSW